MELRINDKVLIIELQNQFNKEFPYLKIEFFSEPRIPSKHLPKTAVYPSQKKLGTCRKIHKDGVIRITPDDTVEKLENIFWNEFGLTAEVFRRSGNLWIETSLTDSWTLKLQNEEGKALSDGFFKLRNKEEDEDITDRDKWD
jgi:hypothetical protein